MFYEMLSQKKDGPTFKKDKTQTKFLENVLR